MSSSCFLLDYQQPLMIGTGTVTRKGSTFRPMDTKDEGRRGSSEFENHYHCPHRANRHEYALPLTSQEPEYATPIIERHVTRESNFPSENGYNVPVVSSQKHSLSAGSFPSSCKTDNRNGDYQTPQSVINYDKPKVNGVLTSVSYSADYQKPQPSALGSEGYSTPRDCLKPISQTAMTALLWSAEQERRGARERRCTAFWSENRVWRDSAAGGRRQTSPVYIILQSCWVLTSEESICCLSLFIAREMLSVKTVHLIFCNWSQCSICNVCNLYIAFI